MRKLPRRAGDEIVVEAFDSRLIVKKITGAYFARVEGESRGRFGNADQIREDVRYFLQNGVLPRSKSGIFG